MNHDTWNAIYRLLRQLGYPRPVIGHVGPNGKGKLQVAWPDRQVGLAVTDIDDPGPFKRAGWDITTINVRQLAAIAPAIEMLDELNFAHRLATSRMDAKASISKTEQNLLRELLRLGMPNPDRNVEVIDPETGQLLTIPDFAWTAPNGGRLGVFVDGWYFHGGQDRDKVLELAASDPRLAARLEQSERDKTTRDTNARRHMTATGWTVIAVTDKEIDDPHERARSARAIRAAWDMLNGRPAATAPPPASTPPAPPPASTAPDQEDRSVTVGDDLEVPTWAQ